MKANLTLSIFIILCAVLWVQSETETNKTTTTDDIDEDYSDYVDENEVSKQSRQRKMNAFNRVGVTYHWDRWEKWSKCSTTCVQIKRRKCIERSQNGTESESAITRAFYPPDDDTKGGGGHFGCAGILKRYRLCKDDRCKAKNQRLRDEQCESYNNVAYREKFYNWRSYEKEHDECELYCRAVNSDLFIGMNQSVTDGTPCNRPAVYYTHFYRRQAVCIEGLCRAVHTSGSIRPATTRDSKLKCGSVLCKQISEIFNKTRLSHGYTLIATIPIGAMNLTIKQLIESENMLALKSVENEYIINGNDRPSNSGIFTFNDDTFDYNHQMQKITSKGPLGKPIILQLFVRKSNASVQFNYTLPMPSAALTDLDDYQVFWDEFGNVLNDTGDFVPRHRRHRKFSWKLLGFGPCNRSCGSGTQTPIFRCVRESPARFYSPQRCAHVEKPSFSDDIYICNRGLCPAFWRPSNFSECQCNSGSDGGGIRKRHFQCMQEQINGHVIEVDEKLCATKTEISEPCSCPKAKAAIQAVADSTTRSVFKRNSHYGGTWLMSSWRGQCARSACVPGIYQHRSIYCQRASIGGDLCDVGATPEQKRPCPRGHETTAAPCELGVWLTSEWSDCSGDCLNLQRWRSVLCLSGGQLVDESKCDKSRKPNEWRRCMRNEADYCGPQWHYSEWSQCSRSCGSGLRRRQSKCLDLDWQHSVLVESNNCLREEREELVENCNLPSCRTDDMNNVGVDIDENCVDSFKNCDRINRNNFCQLEYYKNYCCRSCYGY